MPILIRSKCTGGGRSVYHTDPDCSMAADKSREITPDVLARMDLRQCEWCADE
ncbi:Ada-like Zn-binding domain protein [Haloferax tailed virus 1]|uniref:Ada-like Zn-binding domain protein n=1 Tax=Haloferax tailed virus 1 TaxID=2507575 RepID=A0A410N6P9_HFTV1|nr:Ada-like Zn-binding domain protein [Haloferax tailed virus 1]QAS68841.1 Ada-like Zn-binding domain protein [Haloferax tailed virus 1]